MTAGDLARWLPGADPETLVPLPRPDDGALDPLRTDAPDDESFAPPLPWALPACADTLRRAGEELRRLPIAVRVAGLHRVARSWLDPDDGLRRAALERLPPETGLSPAMVGWGLDRAFEVVTPEALEAWWADDGGAPRVRLTGHVHAGNVFTAGLPPVLGSLLAGVPALIKAPSACPTFPGLLARSFALHAPELGPCVAAAGWSRRDDRATAALLGSVDALFAFGDDASVDALRAASPCPVFGFGHRVSAGFVARGHEGVEGLAVDALAWDGGGCLTPRWVFVEGHADRARALADALVPALEAASAALPAGPGSEASGAARASWIGVEGALGHVRWGEGWAVSARLGPSLDPSPPGRCVAFLPIADRRDLLAALSPLGPRMQGVALVGPPDLGQELRSLLAPLGLSRAVAAGRLQIPELAWSHDDVALLPALR